MFYKYTDVQNMHVIWIWNILICFKYIYEILTADMPQRSTITLAPEVQQ